MRPVTVGLIGCGNISAAYLRAAPDFPELTIVCCGDLDASRATTRAGEFGLRATGIDDLLADPLIEVVLNLTIPDAHEPVGLSALAHGKHLHGEEPLAASTEGGRRLLDAAARAGLRMGAVPDTFLGGAHQTARKLVDDGAIGRPLSGTAFMLNHRHEHWHPGPGFYYAPGGGPMFDMGPYYLTNLVNLLGPVERVMGAATAGFTEREVGSEKRRGERIPVRTATHVNGLLHFVSGPVVTIATSFDVCKPVTRSSGLTMKTALIPWSGWEGHEPLQCVDIVAAMLREEGFAVTVANGTAALAAPGLAGFSLIVTMASISREEAEHLDAAVQSGVDPNRIGVLGASAGGNLTAMLGTMSGRVAYEPVDAADRLPARPDFEILLYPVISMEDGITHAVSRTNLLGKEPTSALIEQYSLDKQVTKDVPPTFIVVASDDSIVPPANSLRYHAALTKAGVPAELHVFKEGDHGFGIRDARQLPVSNWPTLAAAWVRSIGMMP